MEIPDELWQKREELFASESHVQLEAVNHEILKKASLRPIHDIPPGTRFATLGHEGMLGPLSGLSQYADCFFEAGQALIERAQVVRALEADRLALVALYCFRHSIELHLKEIAGSYAYWLAEEPKLDAHHKLSKLWETAATKLKQFWPQEGPRHMGEIGRLITELSDLDPEAIVFRYPMDKKWKGTIPAPITFSLKNLSRVMQLLQEHLDGWSSGIDAEGEARAEARADAAAMAREESDYYDEY